MIKKSIEQYKEEILAQKGMSVPSPMQFNNYFQLALEKILPDVLNSVLENLVQDKAFMSHIALMVLNEVNIPPGKPGYTPKKGIDYDDGKNYILTNEDKQDIAKMFGKVIVEKTIVEKQIITEKPIINEITKIEQIENEETGQEIVEKINSLEIKPSLQIDAKHIKNLPVRQGTDMSGGIARGGLKLIWNTKLSGLVNGSNAVFTIPAGKPDPKDDKFIVSVRGVLKTADAGDFTVSNSNRTITFPSALPNGSDSPRIILYHGK